MSPLGAIARGGFRQSRVDFALLGHWQDHCLGAKHQRLWNPSVGTTGGDLQTEFPGTAGFSPQNVWFMRGSYLAWSAMQERLSQPVRESSASAPPDPLHLCRVLKKLFVAPAVTVIGRRLDAPPAPDCSSQPPSGSCRRQTGRFSGAARRFNPRLDFPCASKQCI